MTRPNAPAANERIHAATGAQRHAYFVSGAHEHTARRLVTGSVAGSLRAARCHGRPPTAKEDGQIVNADREVVLLHFW